MYPLYNALRPFFSFCFASAFLMIAGMAPKSALAQTVASDCSQRVAMFDFFVDSSVPSNAQQEFRDRFCVQLTKVLEWAADNQWPVPPALPRMKIYIGEHYKLARSLVPAWEGDRGRFEFPARRVLGTGNLQADIAHELTHYFFPNGNRMLAEGLAVYVQEKFDVNVYPNFGLPIHQTLSCALSSAELATISLARLDKIMTPAAPALPELDADGDDHMKEAYIVAGSFARFLIEKYGIDKFRNLYARTSFEPGRHIPRTKDDWTDVYQRSLFDLEVEWKATIPAQATVACPP
jgi:hypothetical protein